MWSLFVAFITLSKWSARAHQRASNLFKESTIGPKRDGQCSIVAIVLAA